MNHTGENIAKILKNTFQEFDIEQKIIVGVSDNATNMSSAIETDLKHSHLRFCLMFYLKLCRCFAHTLQLCIENCLVEESIVDVITKAKQLTKYFKKSVVASGELKTAQIQLKMPELKLVKLCPTRY
jgi:hypothetical protein